MITRRNIPTAVLLGIEEYESFTRAKAAGHDSLNRAFDQGLAAIQTAKVRTATKAAFDASAKQLARAAVKAARKRD